MGIQPKPDANTLAVTGRAKSQNQSAPNTVKKQQQKESNAPKTNVNGTKTLSKAQKRKLRMQRKKNGIPETVQKKVGVVKQALAIKAESVQSSISAESPYQTPMQAP